MMNNKKNAMEIIENREMRDRMAERVDVLDKVKALTLLPDDMHVTVAMAAEFYEVGRNVLDVLIQRNKQELVSDGLWTLRGQELRKYKLTYLHDVSELKKVGALMLIPRRVLLRIGMLLRDSNVAKQVRSYLLNVEEIVHKEARDIVERALPHDYLSALEQLIESEKACKELELANRLQAEIIAEQQLIVERHKQLTESEGLLTGNEVAKLYGVGHVTLYNFLRREGFFLRGQRIADQRFVDEGYCITVQKGSYPATRFTMKGLGYVGQLLQKHNMFRKKAV